MVHIGHGRFKNLGSSSVTAILGVRTLGNTVFQVEIHVSFIHKLM